MRFENTQIPLVLDASRNISMIGNSITVDEIPLDTGNTLPLLHKMVDFDSQMHSIFQNIIGQLQDLHKFH
jgi:hypothetical protein